MIWAVRVKVTNAAHTAAPPLGIEAAPVNNFIPSLIKSLRITFNGTTVMNLDSYPVYCHLLHKLTCDDNDYNTWCATQCLVKETDFDKNDSTNASFQKRRSMLGAYIKDEEGNEKFAYSSTSVFFMAALPHYLPHIEYLPNVDIGVEMDLAPDRYCFVAKDANSVDIGYVIEKASLLLPSKSSIFLVQPSSKQHLFSLFKDNA